MTPAAEMFAAAAIVFLNLHFKPQFKKYGQHNEQASGTFF
jgi:hypothetical protein